MSSLKGRFSSVERFLESIGKSEFKAKIFIEVFMIDVLRIVIYFICNDVWSSMYLKK
tara:strand:- start:19491 stop:19661 length:171 start_codon:yes stop_codon:yes gene_type:complete